MRLLPPQFQLVLGSQSPRRKQLLQQVGYKFRCLSADVDEEEHPDLPPEELAEFLAEKKAAALLDQLAPQEILLTADTIVWCQGQSLAKAASPQEAKKMLSQLSGRSHQVISGVCLQSQSKKITLHDAVTVEFATLSPTLMEHYIRNYQPFDKAGAYGIQEWIGLVGIKKIEGSYFTVMGLPTQKIFETLKNW
jgi:septum formation protein